MQDRDATILFDECSEIPKDVTMALLTILNPNPEHQNLLLSWGLYDWFWFSRLSFMFATTETQSVFHALMDRLERVDLEEYTLEEMGKIVSLNLEVKIEPKALKDISSVLRGNARAGHKRWHKKLSHIANRIIQKHW